MDHTSSSPLFFIILALLFYLHVTVAAAAAAAAAKITANNTFDYIIAGGGTCGLLLANRLSEDPSVTVAVIEPGGDVRSNTNVTDPAKFTDFPAFNTPIDWAYPTVSQRGANNRTLTLHSGKALGGTSTINGMTYIRADAAEIDAWETLGSAGWNWASLFPYYKKVERFTRPTETQVREGGASFEPRYHGEEGNLHVGFPYSLPNGSLYTVVRDTWEALGYPLNVDVNSGYQRGFDVWPMTIDRDRDLRWDAAQAYYYPVDGRPNLHVIRGTVSKILWREDEDDDSEDGKVADGVQYVDSEGNNVIASAEREVILSAGALRTPLILEGSGVGNTGILEGLGIETVIDLEGVGEHLQEQPNTAIYFTGTLNTSGYGTYAAFANAADLFGAKLSAVAASTGAHLADYAAAVAAASASSANGGAVTNTTALEQIYQVQHDLIFAKNVTIGETLTTYFEEYGYFVSSHWLLLPFSRGSVHLSSSSSSSRQSQINSPRIDPRYFLVDFDMEQEVAIGMQVHDFWHTSPMGDYIAANVSADPGTDEEWVEYITNHFTPNYHPVGTAAMMARELGGVLDSELKVYGTRNVRVVDASIFPLQVSGHLTSTLYAVAERTSDIIRGRPLLAAE